MNRHLSALELDEVAVELSAPAAKAHLNECAACRAKVEKLGVARAQLIASPPFERGLETLRRASAPPPRPRFPRLWLAMPALAMAAAGLFWVVQLAPPLVDSSSRIKGGATLQVLPALERGPALRQAKPGDKVTLALGAAGHSYAVVVGVDERGQVTELWPRDGMGRIPPGAFVRLEPSFEVTPGSLSLFAFLADAPLDRARVERLVSQAAQAQLSSNLSPLDLKLGALPGEAARAGARLDVQGPPR